MAQEATALVVNGWSLFTHPSLNQQVASLEAEVMALRRKDAVGYVQKNATKRLEAIKKLITEVIPQDPTRTEYRLGGTLGEAYKHWFRAKFFQQYRLFFRFHLSSRTIVFAWVNDDSTKRAYESTNDAYKVFRKLIGRDYPPDDWDALLAQAKNKST